MKEGGKTGLKKELEINHICKEEECKIVKKPSSWCMSVGEKNPHCGKGTKLYLGLQEQKHQTDWGRDVGRRGVGIHAGASEVPYSWGKVRITEKFPPPRPRDTESHKTEAESQRMLVPHYQVRKLWVVEVSLWGRGKSVERERQSQREV